MSDSLLELAERYKQFVDDRNWDQFHTPQNLAMAISIEASELLDEFLWFNNPPTVKVREDDELMEAVQDELADILIYTLGMANQLDIDLSEAVVQKMAENEERFDEELAADLSEQLAKWQ